MEGSIAQIFPIIRKVRLRDIKTLCKDDYRAILFVIRCLIMFWRIAAAMTGTRNIQIWIVVSVLVVKNQQVQIGRNNSKWQHANLKYTDKCNEQFYCRPYMQNLLTSHVGQLTSSFFSILNHFARMLKIPLVRSVAQPGSAPVLGTGSRRFESCRSDHFYFIQPWS